MKKTFLLLALSISIASIFFSCQKEFNDNHGNNAPGSNRRGPKGPKTNRPPVANAGYDQVITLPTNSANLNGGAYDPDNNIASYQWTKVTGPSSFTIANPNSGQTQVTSLVVGVYQFELKVTDQLGLYDTDTVQVTVLSSWQPSLPPCTSCKIVFVSARDGNNEIYTSNTDGSNITRLTNDPADDDHPAWSPDGTRIAFIRNADVFIMNADGSNLVQRTFSAWCWSGLTWSPDGTKIAYSDGMGIYVVSATAGSPILLSEGIYFSEVSQPAWSPDGTKIALVNPTFQDRDGYYYRYDIYTMNSNGGGFTGLNYFNSGYDNFDSPSWSPNGAKLAVWFNYAYVGVMNSDGSGFSLLTSGGATTSWSADGVVIVYNSPSGDVSWVAPDGSAGGTIVTNAWNADWQH